MKWIDMLKERFKSRNYVARKSENHIVKYDMFEYDVSISDNDVSIFLEYSDVGYVFPIKNNKVVWEHDQNAQLYYSDDVINEVNNLVKSYFEK